jgi:hypothetical protein
VRDHRGDAARSCRRPVGLARIALVADGGAGFDVRSDIEERLEMAGVGGFSARQVEGDDVARCI